MRIINVSNFSTLRLKNCFINDVIIKVTNGIIRNGHEVINYSDRDIYRFFKKGIMGFKAKDKMQKHFIDFCLRCQPDVIMLCHADTIKPSSLEAIKKALPNVKILQYNLDCIEPSIGEAPANIKKLQSKLDVVDATLITTAQKELLDAFKGKGFVGYLPNPVDTSLETAKSFEKENLEYDLMFGGTASLREFCGENVLCVDVIDMIKKNIDGIKIKVFGLNKQNKIEGPDYQNLHSKCAMGFNFSRINDCYLYSSDRMAHIMGNGLLCVMQEDSGFKDIFSDDEICYYKTPEECVEKLAFYKNNPQERMKVAKAGYDKYVELFNERVIAQYMLDVLFDNLDDSKYPWLKLVK
jgi:hypothetical protein